MTDYRIKTRFAAITSGVLGAWAVAVVSVFGGLDPLVAAGITSLVLPLPYIKSVIEAVNDPHTAVLVMASEVAQKEDNPDGT